MSGPTEQKPGATPPQDAITGAPEQETPSGEAAAQAQAAAAEQPTAQMPPAHATTAAATAGRDGPWYRRPWAVIAGAVAGAAVLFLGGMAVGNAVWADDGRGGFPGDHPDMFRDGGGERPGNGGWGDNEDMMPPGTAQGMGQGNGWRGEGDCWRGGGDCRDRAGNDPRGDDRYQTPGATPTPLTSPPSSAE